MPVRRWLVLAAALSVALTGCTQSEAPTTAAPTAAAASASPAAPVAPAAPPPLAVPAPDVKISGSEFTQADAQAAAPLAGRFVDATRRNPALFRLGPKTAEDFAAVMTLLTPGTREQTARRVDAYVRSLLNGGTDETPETVEGAKSVSNAFSVVIDTDIIEGSSVDSETRVDVGVPDPSGAFGPGTLADPVVYDDPSRPGELFLQGHTEVTYFVLGEDDTPEQVAFRQKITFVLVRSGTDLIIDGYSFEQAEIDTGPRA